MSLTCKSLKLNFLHAFAVDGPSLSKENQSCQPGIHLPIGWKKKAKISESKQRWMLFVGATGESLRTSYGKRGAQFTSPLATFCRSAKVLRECCLTKRWKLLRNTNYVYVVYYLVIVWVNTVEGIVQSWELWQASSYPRIWSRLKIYWTGKSETWIRTSARCWERSSISLLGRWRLVTASGWGAPRGVSPISVRRLWSWWSCLGWSTSYSCLRRKRKITSDGLARLRLTQHLWMKV